MSLRLNAIRLLQMLASPKLSVLNCGAALLHVSVQILDRQQHMGVQQDVGGSSHTKPQKSLDITCCNNCHHHNVNHSQFALSRDTSWAHPAVLA